MTQPQFQLSDPLIIAGQQLFEKAISVELRLGFPGVEIYYTTDGSTPDRSKQRYQDPFQITESCTLQAIAYKDGWLPSDVSTRDFFKIRLRIADVSLETPPSEKYPGKGATSLIDLNTGNLDYRSDNWLGYEAAHLTATLDLGQPTVIEGISVSCLRDHHSWIFSPAGISVSVSPDNENFSPAGQQSFPAPTLIGEAALQFLNVSFTPQSARYVRVQVENLMTLPDWHAGAGGKAWLFVDEILIS